MKDQLSKIGSLLKELRVINIRVKVELIKAEKIAKRFEKQANPNGLFNQN